MMKNIIRLALILGCLFGHTIFALNAQQTLEGLNTYVKKYHNKLIPITTGKLAGKFLLLDFDFLHPNQEALLEAEDLFFHNWKKNQRPLTTLASKTGKTEFLNKQGFTAVSIGSSSTQAYHMVGDKMEDIRTFEYFLGSEDFMADNARANLQLQFMLADLSAVKNAQGQTKPIVFMNSIAFATPTNVAVTGFDAINLTTGLTPLFGSKDKRDAGLNTIANRIVSFLNNSWEITNAYLLKTKNKSDKILNKWTNALVQRLFKAGELGYVADMGGNGFSLKLVENLAFEDSFDYIKKYNSTDKYLESQNKFVEHFISKPDENYGVLDEAIERIINTAINGLEIEWFSSNNTALRTQKVFKIAIRQSGRLRKLFLDAGGSFRANDPVAMPPAVAAY
jgi:hypothetical protein